MAVLVVVILLVILGGVAAAALILSSDDDDTASGPKSAAETTTTIPRLQNVVTLTKYCEAPGKAWSEVPAHVPGEPSRTLVVNADVNMEQGWTGNTDPSSLVSTWSTVISPTTDGRITADNSVLERTRSVTCVTKDREEVLETCDYTDQASGQPITYERKRVIYNLTVYELHSGGVLHKGEIIGPDGSCPMTVYGGSDEQFAPRIKSQAVLDWMTSHFVDGQPN